METPRPNFEEIGATDGFQAETGEVEDKADDPRDYFKKTIFEKIGRKIDPDSDHPWDDIYNDSLLVRSEHGTVISGTTYSYSNETGENEFGLLLAAKSVEGEVNSAYLENYEDKQISVVSETLSSFAPVIPSEQRISYANGVISGLKQIDNTYPAGLMALQLSEFSLSQLPDYPKGSTNTPISIELGEERATTEQTEQITRVLEAVAPKMDQERFAIKLNDLLEDIRLEYLNEPFGANFAHLITRIAKWPVDYGSEHKPDYESLRRDQPKTFSVTDQVRRPIHSREQLQEILEHVPAEEIPPEALDPEKVTINGQRAEFVELNRLVGGRLEANSWTVSSSLGRGVENIYRLTELLQSEEGGPLETVDPMSVIEFDGKYYIETDGRHRAAALKALGVARYPMMVRHITRKNTGA